MTEEPWAKSWAAEPLDDAPRLTYADDREEHGLSASELRAMIAEPAFRRAVSVEEDFGRGIADDSRDGMAVVGVRRGGIEYVRLTIGHFYAALDLLAQLPLMVVDFMGLDATSANQGAPYFSLSTVPGNDFHRNWDAAAPHAIPKEVARLTTVGNRRKGRLYYPVGRAYRAMRWDLSRAAVRWVRELANNREMAPSEFQQAERFWAGFDLERAQDTDYPPPRASHPVWAHKANGVERYTGMAFWPFGDSSLLDIEDGDPTAERLLLFASAIDADAHWNRQRWQLARLDPVPVGRKVSRNPRRTANPIPITRDSLFGPLPTAVRLEQERALALYRDFVDCRLDVDELVRELRPLRLTDETRARLVEMRDAASRLDPDVVRRIIEHRPAVGPRDGAMNIEGIGLALLDRFERNHAEEAEARRVQAQAVRDNEAQEEEGPVSPALSQDGTVPGGPGLQPDPE